MEPQDIGWQHRGILAAMRELGPGWHTRAELAKHLKKNRLNAAEIAALDGLVIMGVAETQWQPAPPPRENVNRRVYRLRD